MAHLAEFGVASLETVDARKERYDGAAVLQLLQAVDRVVSIKGKNVQTFALKHERPEEAALLAAVLGPTGNLRAPAVRVGRTLVVGFGAEVYDDLGVGRG
jgi:hypothetical protein